MKNKKVLAAILGALIQFAFIGFNATAFLAIKSDGCPDGYFVAHWCDYMVYSLMFWVFIGPPISAVAYLTTAE